MMAPRSKAPAAKSGSAESKEKEVPALLASLAYYGVYCVFFGKMVLVLLERLQ